MAVSYKPLWKTLIDKGLNKTKLREELNLSPTILAKMGKDEYVSLKTLESICTFLNCKIEEVVEVTQNRPLP
jgi:putative transcriptional regulator